jgi:hypothetical protein
MVGHEAVGEEAHVEAFDGLVEDGFAGGVVGVFMEAAGACRGAVHDVVDETGLDGSGFAGQKGCV